MMPSSSFFFTVTVIVLATMTMMPSSSSYAAAHSGIKNITEASDLVSDACAIDKTAKERNFDSVKNMFERQEGLKHKATTGFPITPAAATANAVARAIDGMMCNSEMYRQEMIRKGVSGILLNLATDLLISQGDKVDTDLVAVLLGADVSEPKGCTPVAKIKRRNAEFDLDNNNNSTDPRDFIQKRLTAIREGDAASASKARNELLTQLSVAPIQGALKYSALIDPKAGSITYGELDKERAEGFAYLYPIMNQIAKCEAASDSASIINDALGCSPKTAMPSGVSEGDTTTSRSTADDGVYYRVLSAVEKAYTCLALSGDANDFKQRVGTYSGISAGLTPEGFQD